MKTAVSIERLSKMYRLGVIGSGTLHQDLTRWWARVRGRPDPLLKVGEADQRARRGETIWALRDVSVEVQEGEIVGIIGRNGAGKSTLLKILSRVTAPTSGEIKLRGRVASLLEVGTGFHPELTGRENVLLNGAILGMSKAEIRRKFDEIVAFAEVDEFLDTPVKRYSSGMYVRLAFAVAAHLDPEILVVDEVLAVGDAAFQKKCIGKMGEVAKGGRTVLFVSHNMGTINRLCERAVLLHDGKVRAVGPVLEVTAQYLRSGDATMAERLWADPGDAPGDASARLRAVRVIQQGVVAESVDIRFPVSIEMEYDVLTEGAQLICAFSFFDEQGTFLFVSPDTDDPIWSRRRPSGRYLSRCEVPGNLFAEGQVRVVAEVSTRAPVYQIHFLQYDAVAFQVVDKGEPGSVRAGWGRPMGGVLRPKCGWATRAVGGAEADAAGES